MVANERRLRLRGLAEDGRDLVHERFTGNAARVAERGWKGRAACVSRGATQGGFASAISNDSDRDARWKAGGVGDDLGSFGVGGRYQVRGAFASWGKSRRIHPFATST